MPSRYQRVADALRDRIMAGDLRPGATVPSAATLAHEFDVGRDTALKGLAVLRREGLLFLAPDKTIRVGPAQSRHTSSTRGPLSRPDEVLDLPPDGVVWSRMPTRKERERLDLAEGVPVLVLRTPTEERILAADRVSIRWSRRE